MGSIEHTSNKSRYTPWIVVGAVLLVLAVMLAGSAMHREGGQDLLQVLSGAYPRLAACPDFTRMSPADGGVCLTLTDGTEQYVPMPAEFTALFGRRWPHPFRLIYGWKAGDDVYFVTGGAVDDNWGYVVSGDAAVGTEGLHVLKRVGGNAWYFSTVAE